MNAREESPPAAPKLRYDQSASDMNKRALEKLMSNPTKLAYVPDAPRPKEIRAPRDMMRNVMGSSAGAGSGEFHIYKQARRREYERLQIMEEDEKRQFEEAKAKMRQAELEAINGAVSSKNKAKRDKKKARRQKVKEDGSRPMDESDESDAAPPIKKTKMAASGAALTFRDREERAEDENPPAPEPVCSAKVGISVVDEE